MLSLLLEELKEFFVFICFKKRKGFFFKIDILFFFLLFFSCVMFFRNGFEVDSFF